jgi:malate synthase
VTADDVRRVTDEEAERLGDGYAAARELFEQVATQPEYVEFLTLPAYERLA